jgi:hypothetical protein
MRRESKPHWEREESAGVQEKLKSDSVAVPKNVYPPSSKSDQF